MKKRYTRSTFEEETGWKFGRFSWTNPTVTGLRIGATPLKAESVARHVVSDISVIGSPRRFYIRWETNGAWVDGPFIAEDLDKMIEFSRNYMLAECPRIKEFC